jgi:Cu+-exporting ATPase
MSGVTSSNVNYAIAQAVIEFDEKKLSVATIQQKIKDIGYEASLPEEIDGDRQKKLHLTETQDLTRKVAVGGVVSCILVVGSLPMMTGVHISFIPAWLHNAWFQLIMALPIQLWCGSSFYIGAWKALKNRTATMDTLIGLGTLAAFSYSLTVTLNPNFLISQGLRPEVYYEVSVVVITLILMGKLFENRAKGETSDAIRKLIGLQAKTARVLLNKCKLMTLYWCVQGRKFLSMGRRSQVNRQSMSQW